MIASKGYPVLTTTNLMTPEVYVLESLIDSWLNFHEGEVLQFYHFPNLFDTSLSKVIKINTASFVLNITISFDDNRHFFQQRNHFTNIP